MEATRLLVGTSSGKSGPWGAAMARFIGVREPRCYTLTLCMKLHEFQCYFREVGRATVPANTGRHGGRPYDSTRLKFFFDLTGRFFWPAAALNTDT